MKNLNWSAVAVLWLRANPRKALAVAAFVAGLIAAAIFGGCNTCAQISPPVSRPYY